MYYRIIHKDADNFTGIINSWSEKRCKVLSILKNATPLNLNNNQFIDYSRDLFIEFGSTNAIFYKDQLNFTLHLLKNWQGRVIFLNDDPDLLVFDQTLFKQYINKVKFVFVSCGNTDYIKHIFPFSKIIKYNFNLLLFDNVLPKQNITFNQMSGVYYGKDTEGRMFFLKSLQSKLQIDFFGCFGTKIPKINRQDLLKKYGYGICTASNKHINMFFYTGRLFHYLKAGLPVFIDKRCLQFMKYNITDDVNYFQNNLTEIYTTQINVLQKEITQFNPNFYDYIGEGRL